MLEALRDRLPEDSALLSLESFIDCALYHPALGYYRRPRKRVGHREEADFYTASSLGSLFTRLVIASMDTLVEDALEAYSFVELGPESDQGILSAIEAIPFRETRTIRPGEPVEIPDKAIVFSNELFDAQPFRRYIRQEGRWLELGIAVGADSLAWEAFPPGDTLPKLPESAPDGYIIDWPGKAHALLETICQQPWTGLFLAFDYGLERSTLFTQRPLGTGRTYANHQMGNDLLHNPGQVDITCHVIWEELEAIMRKNRFRGVAVQRQETFFMHNGQAVIKDVLESVPAGMSPQKQTLMELLHPDNMGHKFQVLTGHRDER